MRYHLLSSETHAFAASFGKGPIALWETSLKYPKLCGWWETVVSARFTHLPHVGKSMKSDILALSSKREPMMLKRIFVSIPAPKLFCKHTQLLNPLSFSNFRETKFLEWITSQPRYPSFKCPVSRMSMFDWPRVHVFYSLTDLTFTYSTH